MKKELIKLANQEDTQGKNLSNSKLKEIAKKYEEQIKTPKSKIKKQLILCPVGLVGAGKTTVVKPISKKLDLVRISSDEIRKILKQGGFNYIRTIEIAKIVTLKFLNQGHSIAIDGDCVSPEIQEYFNELGYKRKIIIIWIHIKPTEKFIINKLKNYKHTWLFKSVVDAIDNYKRRKSLHKKYLSAISFYYKFDTSKDNLDQQINRFINKLKTDFQL